MEELALQYFPYPHVIRGERRDGALIDWPDRCESCDRQCERGPVGEVSLCSYGLNFLRISDTLLVAGIALRDFPEETAARKKMYGLLRHRLVSRDDLNRVHLRFLDGVQRAEQVIQVHFEQVVEDYRKSKQYHEEIVEGLRPEMQQALAQIHDYKQFVQQIFQNMDVILDKRFPERSLTDKIALADHEEAAILWAAQVMDEKLEAFGFLQNPERIHEVSERGSFELYRASDTYVKIYQRKADQNQLTLSIEGDEDARVEGNTRALGIVPHTLIDNAIKYAPLGTDVGIVVESTRDYARLSVSSFGPEIGKDERDSIFDPFVRGRAAKHMRREGTGYGLAAAQAIAHAHNAHIEAVQVDARGPEKTRRTTFMVEFPTALKLIAEAAS